MQGSPARAAARAGPEWRVDVPVAVQVADAVEGPGRCLDAEAFQLLPSMAPLRRSTTTTSSPARVPCSAVASQ